jgi:hypothetical protein
LRAHHDRRSTASAEISDDHTSINCLRWRSGNSARVCCDVALALAAPILRRLPPAPAGFFILSQPDDRVGTPSSAFVGASLQQLIAAARLPVSGICEIAVNASLAFIEGAKPRGEIECALVIQMACTHSAAMAVLSRLGGAAGGRTVAAMASAAARLLRAHDTQVEALRRLRPWGSQTLRVEHVHVNEGGQALIGNVSSER